MSDAEWPDDEVARGIVPGSARPRPVQQGPVQSALGRAQVPAVFDAANFHEICETLARIDPVFRVVLDEYGYPHLFGRPPTFATLVQIILEQQVSLASARAAYQRLVTKVGTVTPEILLGMSDEDFRACSFTRQKTVYARDLAKAVFEKTLKLGQLFEKSDDEVREALTRIKGIGAWTADVYLMMALHRCDCFPGGDIALVKSAKELLRLPDHHGRDEVVAYAEKWRPYRTVAAFMLWWAYIKKRNIEF